MVKFLSLLSAVFGIAGIALLFWFSYTLPPDRRAVLSHDPEEEDAAIGEINRRWKRMQRIGFALLCISFALQALIVLLLAP